MKKILYYIVSFGLLVVGLGLASIFFLMSQGMDVPRDYLLPILVALVFTVLPGIYFFKIARNKERRSLVSRIALGLELIFVLTFCSILVVVFGSIILPNPISFPGSKDILSSIFYLALISHLVALILLGANWIKKRL